MQSINSHNVPLYNCTAVYHDTQDVPLYHVLWEWHDTICVMVLNNHHIHSVFSWYRLLQSISKMIKNTRVYNDTKWYLGASFLVANRIGNIQSRSEIVTENDTPLIYLT